MKSDAALVQASFDHVKPIADAAAMLLVERLYAVAPDARALFGEAGLEERAALLDAMTAVIDGLGDAGRLSPALTAIARTLAARGVQPAHYDRFGEALIWAMSHALGHRFTPEVKAAWKRSYADVVGRMSGKARAAA